MDDRTEIHTERHGDYVLSIHYDVSPSSPREDDNLTTITAWDDRYNLGDDDSPQYSPEDDEDGAWGIVRDGVLAPAPEGLGALVAWPLNVNDYGSNGIRLDIDTTGAVTLDAMEDSFLPARWNGPDVKGVVYITPSRVEAIGTPPHLFEKAARGEVKAFEDYINGNVYGYVVEKIVTCNLGHEHRELVDSCWGFFADGDQLSDAGYGLGYVLAEARGALPDDAPAAVTDPESLGSSTT